MTKHTEIDRKLNIVVGNIGPTDFFDIIIYYNMFHAKTIQLHVPLITK